MINNMCSFKICTQELPASVEIDRLGLSVQKVRNNTRFSIKTIIRKARNNHQLLLENFRFLRDFFGPFDLGAQFFVNSCLWVSWFEFVPQIKSSSDNWICRKSFGISSNCSQQAYKLFPIVLYKESQLDKLNFGAEGNTTLAHTCYIYCTNLWFPKCKVLYLKRNHVRWKIRT